MIVAALGQSYDDNDNIYIYICLLKSSSQYNDTCGFQLSSYYDTTSPSKCHCLTPLD